MNQYKIELWTGAEGEWRWRLRNRKGGFPATVDAGIKENAPTAAFAAIDAMEKDK